MRKTKVFFILFLILVITILPFSQVNAHSVELDSNSLISFPMLISNGKGNITIKSSETGYRLYYQAVEISNTIYSQIEKTTNSGKAELNDIESEIDELGSKCDSLKTIYDKAFDAYKEMLNSGKTGPELETLKSTYEIAKTNYQSKVTEYNNKVKEYKNKVKEIDEKIKKLTPTYIESNWNKTSDGSFNVDLSSFSGKKAFAVWVKLISSNGTISYDEATYTLSGTKAEEIKVKSVKLNKTTLSLTVDNNYTLTATVTPSNATNKLLDWSSDNEKVAKVKDGKVTAVSEGTANITVATKDGNYTATCKVTVAKKAVTSPATDDKKEEAPKENNTPKKEKNPKNDDTTAKDKLPQTGSSNFVIISAMILLSIIGFVTYMKIKYMNF